MQARREGRKGGKVFPGPETFWVAPPSLKNTEKVYQMASF